LTFGILWYNMLMFINFSKDELNYAINLGTKRHSAKDISFRNSGRIKIQSDVVIESVDPQYYPHIIGVFGEMAYSKLIDEPIDTNIYAVRDSGEDFAGTEVKTITYFGSGEPELKIPHKEYKARNVQTYVLARIDKKDLAKIELLGRISRNEFEKKRVSKQYGPNYPENWVVPLSEMERL